MGMLADLSQEDRDALKYMSDAGLSSDQITSLSRYTPVVQNFNDWQTSTDPNASAEGARLFEDLAFTGDTTRTRTDVNSDYINRQLQELGEDIRGPNGFIDLGIPYTVSFNKDGGLMTGVSQEGDYSVRVGTSGSFGNNAPVEDTNVHGASGLENMMESGVVDLAGAVLAPYTGGYSVAAAQALKGAGGETLKTDDYVQAATAVIGGQISDLTQGGGSWTPPDSIATQMGLPPGTIINFSDITPSMISGVSNPEIAQQLHLLSQTGSTGGGLLSATGGLLGARTTYDAITGDEPRIPGGTLTGPSGSMDLVVDDQPAAPTTDPQDPDGGGGGAPPGGGEPVEEEPTDTTNTPITDEIFEIPPKPEPESGDSGETGSPLDEEHTWIYTGNNTFVDTATGESRTEEGDFSNYTPGERYSIGGPAASNPNDEDADLMGTAVFGSGGEMEREMDLVRDWIANGSDPNTRPDLVYLDNRFVASLGDGPVGTPVPGELGDGPGGPEGEGTDGSGETGDNGDGDGNNGTGEGEDGDGDGNNGDDGDGFPEEGGMLGGGGGGGEPNLLDLVDMAWVRRLPPQQQLMFILQSRLKKLDNVYKGKKKNDVPTVS